MARRFTTLVCITLVSVIIAGCTVTGSEGFGVGWAYQDMDGDNIRNGIDPDVDGDGVPNTHDVYPHDPRHW